jgi:hypothetical protein
VELVWQIADRNIAVRRDPDNGSSGGFPRFPCPPRDAFREIPAYDSEGYGKIIACRGVPGTVNPVTAIQPADPSGVLEFSHPGNAGYLSRLAELSGQRLRLPKPH